MPEHIFTSTLWPAIHPLVRIQRYDRDGGHRHPRHRIEVADPRDSRLRVALLALEVPCCACGRTMHPIRERRGGSPTRHTLYVAVACPLPVRVGCARGEAAHLEYERIIAAVEASGGPLGPGRLTF